MQNISGCLYKKGKQIVSGIVEDISVPEGVNVVNIRARVESCDGSSFFALLGFLVSRYSLDYSADIQMTSITEDGVIKCVRKEGISWNDLRRSP